MQLGIHLMQSSSIGLHNEVRMQINSQYQTTKEWGGTMTYIEKKIIDAIYAYV